MTEEKKDNNKGKKVFEPIPDGIYKVGLEKVEIKTTRKGDGKYLNCMFSIIKGDHKFEKWKLFDMFNLENKSERAVEISRSRLAEMLMAAGFSEEAAESAVLTALTSLTEVEEALSVPILVEVYTKEQEGYKPQNKIKKYMSR